jgi:hypothetical protein
VSPLVVAVTPDETVSCRNAPEVFPETAHEKLEIIRKPGA